MGYIVNRNGRWIEVPKKEYIVKRCGNWVSVPENQLTDVERKFISPSIIDTTNETQKAILLFETSGMALDDFTELDINEQLVLIEECHDEETVSVFSPYGRFITSEEIETLIERVESMGEFEEEALQDKPNVKSKKKQSHRKHL